jgi:hypothetical protein
MSGTAACRVCFSFAYAGKPAGGRLHGDMSGEGIRYRTDGTPDVNDELPFVTGSAGNQQAQMAMIADASPPALASSGNDKPTRATFGSVPIRFAQWRQCQMSSGVTTNRTAPHPPPSPFFNPCRRAFSLQSRFCAPSSADAGCMFVTQ